MFFFREEGNFRTLSSDFRECIVTPAVNIFKRKEKFVKKKILCVLGFHLSVCLCTTCMPSADDRMSDLLELELRMVVSPPVGARNQTQGFYKSNSCS